MVFADLTEQYPYFAKTAEFLENSCFFFKKTFQKIRALGPNYEWSEKMCRNAFELNGRDWNAYLANARQLVDFSVEFIRLQTTLEQTGKYRYSTFEQVEKEVYNSPHGQAVGAPYMWALYFSQVFWVSHQEIFKFFLADFAKPEKKLGQLLEAPLGTGILSTYFLLHNPAWEGVGIDLSETAVDFAKRLLEINNVGRQMKVKKEDINLYSERDGGFQRIICGEFLEHVEDPLGVLRKLHRLLDRDGKLFLNVAVFAAAIDHIYLYESAEDVRQHIREAQFKIEKEFIQNVSPTGKPDQKRTPINYCAILTPKT